MFTLSNGDHTEPHGCQNHNPLQAILWVLTSLLFLSCDETSLPSVQGPVKVGVVLPLEHPAIGMWAREVRNGLEMARNNNAKIQFIYRDDHADPVRSAEVVHNLVNEERVSAIVGCFTSTCCLAAAERAEQLKVPLITPTGTSEEITRSRHWVFRLCFTDPQQGRFMARHARSLNRKKVAIVRDITSDYSTGLASAFSEEFVRTGGTVIQRLSYRGGDLNREELLEWMQSADCDCLFLPVYFRDVAIFLNATMSLWRGKDITFFGGDAWEGDDTDQVEEWPQDVYITSHFAVDLDDEKVSEFLRLYQSFGRVSTSPSSSAALGFDAGTLVVDVLSEGLRQRMDIRQALHKKMKGFAGVTGTISEDPVNRSSMKEVHIKKWDGSSWELYR